jgi:beta-galactosidase
MGSAVLHRGFQEKLLKLDLALNTNEHGISRRRFVRKCALGNLAPLALGSFLRSSTAKAEVHNGPASYCLSLNGDWSFGGPLKDDTERSQLHENALSHVTLPHCVCQLSWQDWDPAAWEHVWLYRRNFLLPPEFRSRRVFLRFDGVMVGASPSINGHVLKGHLGGYLPFQYEITNWLKGGDNVLAIAVDSRWKNVPPEGSPKGPRSIDYLEPGGIFRPVNLYAVPKIFISDVFAKPVNVLDSDRRVEVACSIDTAVSISNPIHIETELMDGSRVISRERKFLKLEAGRKTEVALTLSNLGNIALWDSNHPRLYDVVTTLSMLGKPVHQYRVRTGFRDARFEADGFFLNDRRVQLFGLNRHELYPYVGGAMPTRVLRRDAEILRREFNCNVVRCSHYPQSESFLDACDELGLMVWEEIPGWQYVGDAAWKELAVRDVADMVSRDRNHPAIVIWGVRVNESQNDPALYVRTKEIAHSLDDSRPTSGSMTPSSTRNWQQEWHQDVFAFDDYHSAPDGSVGIRDPLPGVPYMLAEAVGQFNYSRGKGFDAHYRRNGDAALQEAQALRHAQAHEKGMSLRRCAGIIAWCGFDYGSLLNSYRGVKYPGVADVFRIPKLGASFYQAQMNPKIRPVIIPNFYWDFGPETPRGPGQNAAIFSNCDRLEIAVNGKPFTVAKPDRAAFPHLQYPPFFCDLRMDGSSRPELRIDGYIGHVLALSRSFSSDRNKDQFYLGADDRELIGNGSDATRLVFKTVDQFGALRPFTGGEVAFELTGPGMIVGENPFRLDDTGGVGAVWIKAVAKSSGLVIVTAGHSSLGKRSVEIKIRPEHVTLFAAHWSQP